MYSMCNIPTITYELSNSNRPWSLGQ